MKKNRLIGLFFLMLLLTGCASGQDVDAPPTNLPANPGDLYPAQDLSIIAKTNRVQFLNVYANW